LYIIKRRGNIVKNTIMDLSLNKRSL